MNSKTASWQRSRSYSTSTDLIWSPQTAFDQLVSFSKVHKCMLSINSVTLLWSLGYEDIPEQCTGAGFSAITLWFKPTSKVNTICDEVHGLCLPSCKQGISYWLALQSNIDGKQLERRWWMQVCPHSHQRWHEQYKRQLQT